MATVGRSVRWLARARVGVLALVLIGAFLPDEPTDLTHIEGRVPPRILSALRRRGHHVRIESDFAYRVGHAHAIVIRDGTLLGGADPRGDGIAFGY